MAISGSNLDLSFVQETVWGTTPATPQMKQLRGVTSESLGASQESIVSTELNKDRAISDMKAGQKSVGGDINYELGVHGIVALLARQLGNVVSTPDGDKFKHVITVASKPLPLTIEKFFANAGEGYVFRGCYINNSSFSITPEAAVTGAMNIIGKTIEKTSVKLDTTPTTQTHEMFDGIDCSIIADGQAEEFQNLSLNLTNNSTASRAVGLNTPANITSGLFAINGSFSITYNGNNDIIDKAISNTGFSLKVTLTYGDNSVEFLLPNIKVTGDPIPKASSQDQINVEFNFEALQDKLISSPTYAKSIQITVINDEPTL